MPYLRWPVTGFTVYIPYVKGISENFRRISNRYNIRTIFRTKRTLGKSLMKTKQRDMQQTAQCIYSIPCECGRSYIGETGRSLAVRLREHRHNLKEGLLEEAAYTACSANPISQPSLDFSPIWILIISNEVTNSHRRFDKIWVFYWFLLGSILDGHVLLLCWRWLVTISFFYLFFCLVHAVGSWTWLLVWFYSKKFFGIVYPGSTLVRLLCTFFFLALMDLAWS
jgi:hypothetical protein